MQSETVPRYVLRLVGPSKADKVHFLKDRDLGRQSFTGIGG